MTAQTGRLTKTRNSAAAQSVRGTRQQYLQRRTNLHLPQRLQKDVRAEARALGLTNEEYMRLLLALSKSLRHGLLKQQNIDAKALLQLAESPIFSGLIQYVAESAKNLTSSKKQDEIAGREPQQNEQSPANPQSVQQPQPSGVRQQSQQPPLPSPVGNNRLPWPAQQGPFQSPRAQNPAQGSPSIPPFGFAPYTPGRWPTTEPSRPNAVQGAPRAEQTAFPHLPVRAYLP
ncbi:hypothetical protein [Alicyclobacillus sp. ALC3]|uniref:hypothetical protein n=1 Tax=Alicyclobacillus sp. ALC3 TaxID=2796143 RepID=UPI0023796B54|nr:hypothetical protein [Alicyclobacillus sp. ALC3]WDL97457.1 hypothetical protein JC200_01630 [Alicyclobacillus sp. ALC3]